MQVMDVQNLTKDYGSGRGVFDVSFGVEQGEVFGFLGPNGAGKSTTIRHLMGFSRPDSGTVSLFGKPSFERYHEILGKVGYIPGEIALPAGLTGWEFLRMMQELQGVRREDQLENLLRLFELDPTGETKRMSLGIKRKLAIVTAFMSDPEVLILDEPTSGLDPVMQEVFIDYIRREKQRGKSILLSSHIFSEVDVTCDRIAIIKDGHLMSVFRADDLHHAEQKTYEISFAEPEEYRMFRQTEADSPVLKIMSADDASSTVQIVTEDKQINEVVARLSRYKIRNFTHRRETLQDYFMSYYKEDKDFKGAL